MPQFAALLAAAATLLVCYAGGRAFLSRLQLALTPLEVSLFSLLCGSALVSLLVLATGLAGLLHPLSFLLLAFLIAGAAVWNWRAFPVPNRDTTPLPLPWRWALGLLFLVYGAAYLAVAMSPEISPDGMAYHLPLIQRYLRDGRIGRIDTDLYAQLSQGLEMLFLPAYAWGRHSAAALVHLAFLAALPLLMIAYGLRRGYAVPAAAAAALVFLSPVAGTDGSAAYNDMALATVLFAAFFALSCWQRQSHAHWLWVAGLLTGFAYGIKYTGVFALPLGLTAVLWPAASPRRRLANALQFIVPALLMILPWLLKNLAFTGNPLAPFFNAWFPNNVMDWPLEKEYFRAVQNYTGYTSATTIPWEVTVLGGTLQGLLGPVFLLLPLGLVALRNVEGRRLLAFAAVGLLPFAINHGTRFLLPGLAFLALALAHSLSRWPWLLAVLVAFHAIASWPGVVERYAAPHAWRIKEIPWNTALGRETESEFLARHLPEFPVLEALQTVARPGEPVLAFRQYAASYTPVQLFTDNHSRIAAELCRLLYIPVLEAQHPTAGERFWFPAVNLTGIRLQKTPGSIMTATEVRFYDLMEPVRPSSAWAKSYPARDDAALGFDGNRLTRWRGGLNPNTAAYLELTWQASVRISRVDLEHRPIHPAPAVTLYGRHPDGQWNAITDHTQPLLAGPLPEVRLAATQEMLRRGIRYVLLHQGDLIASDVQANLTRWNWRVVHENRGITLYRLLPSSERSSR